MFALLGHMVSFDAFAVCCIYQFYVNFTNRLLEDSKFTMQKKNTYVFHS